MKSILKKTTDEPGIYNKEIFSKLQSTPYYDKFLLNSHKFLYSYATSSLRQQLEEICKEKVNFNFIAGRYNPFIRDYPFPPLRLNLNYLFDPRSILYSFAYEKLYDEHKDGLVTNRAASLYIPGIFIINIMIFDLMMCCELCNIICHLKVYQEFLSIQTNIR
jgi:hypothetical protein